MNIQTSATTATTAAPRGTGPRGYRGIGARVFTGPGAEYHFLSAGKTDAALQIFQLEVQEYPKFWNAYDSLAEAFAIAGQKEQAIENYQKSVELNPQNQGGIDALKKLQEQK